MASYYLRPGYDFADEFEIGLDAVLDSVSRWLVVPEDERRDHPPKRR
jgi:hypothetical protein